MRLLQDRHQPTPKTAILLFHSISTTIECIVYACHEIQCLSLISRRFSFFCLPITPGYFKYYIDITERNMCLCVRIRMQWPAKHMANLISNFFFRITHAHILSMAFFKHSLALASDANKYENRANAHCMCVWVFAS